MNGLTPEQLVGIPKSIPNKYVKEARDTLMPGEYPFKGVFDIRGVLSVGEDEEYIPVAKIPLRLAFALFVKKTGIVGPKVMRLLVQAINEAAELADNDVEGLRAMEELNEAEDLVRQALRGLDPQTRRGKTRLTQAFIEKV